MADKLYASSFASLPFYLILTILLTIALYPMLNSAIFIWVGIFILLLIFRLYLAYAFKKHGERYSKKHWYITFVVLAIISVIIFSFFGFYFMHQANNYYKLFIGSAILGVSLGASHSLSSDFRLNFVHNSILLVPLFLTLLFAREMPEHWILAISVLLYYSVQIYQTYNQNIQTKNLYKLESIQDLLHTLFKNAPIGMFTYDEAYTILDCNTELTKVFKNDAKNMIGMDLKSLPDSRPKEMFKSALKSGRGSYNGAYTSVHGENFWMDMKAFSYEDKCSGKIGIVMIENKTKEKNISDSLAYMAEHDVLTGLLNRRGFINYIDHLVHDERHQKYYSILFYLDLNQFKSINDSLGHVVGDKILLAVAKRLKNVLHLNKECFIGRLGGDEFIVIVPYILQEKEETKKEAQRYVTAIQGIFLEVFMVNQMHLHIQGSTGIVLIEPQYHNTEELLRYADLTMYQAKNTYNHISYYDSSLDKKQKELFLLQHNLAYATKNDQLKLYFQPIVKMKDERLYSAELLIRWEHPSKGILSPEAFIPLAIKGGLLSKITWWIIDNVCQQIVQWKKDGHWKMEYISININPQQFIEKNFAEEFFKKLAFYHIETSEIMIEITERSLIDNFSKTQGVISTLRERGVKCAVDDFGIGYSSLSYLKKLSFHTLKIDRTFVNNIGESAKELILIHTILNIGHQFGYQIVIEGIENKQQKKVLLELDDGLYYQGYLYSKPTNAYEFTKKFLA